MRWQLLLVLLRPLSAATICNENVDCEPDEFCLHSQHCAACHSCGSSLQSQDECDKHCSCNRHDDCRDGAYCGEAHWGNGPHTTCLDCIACGIDENSKPFDLSCPSKCTCQSSSDCKQNEFCDNQLGSVLRRCRPCRECGNPFPHNETCEEVCPDHFECDSHDECDGYCTKFHNCDECSELCSERFGGLSITGSCPSKCCDWPVVANYDNQHKFYYSPCSPATSVEAFWVQGHDPAATQGNSCSVYQSVFFDRHSIWVIDCGGLWDVCGGSFDATVVIMDEIGFVPGFPLLTTYNFPSSSECPKKFTMMTGIAIGIAALGLVVLVYCLWTCYSPKDVSSEREVTEARQEAATVRSIDDMSDDGL